VRSLAELPGPHHPAVYEIVFACGCGEEHPGLVAQDELDLAPLGLEEERTFVNLMTSRADSLGGELTELAAQRIKAGEWPWSFFCFIEDRPRPGFPSAFRLLAHSAPGGPAGAAGRRRVWGAPPAHLAPREPAALPSHNDREIGVVGHVFPDDAAATVAAFTAELYSASFDARRLGLG